MTDMFSRATKSKLAKRSLILPCLLTSRDKAAIKGIVAKELIDNKIKEVPINKEATMISK